jgi:tellurite resistance protein TerC
MHPVLMKTIQQAKRFIVIVVGFTILAIGIVMIVLPGPAVIVIPLGLGILASELVWARRFLNSIKRKILREEEIPHADETK